MTWSVVAAAFRGHVRTSAFASLAFIASAFAFSFLAPASALAACGTISTATTISAAETGPCTMASGAALTIDGSGSLTNASGHAITGGDTSSPGSAVSLGSIIIDGTVTATGGYVLNLVRGTKLSPADSLTGNIEINGEASSTNSRGLYINDFDMTGDIVVGSAGTLSAASLAIHLVDATSITGNIINNGTIRTNGGTISTASTVVISGAIQNAGTIYGSVFAISTGTASIAGGIVNQSAATIIGQISTAADLTNNGIIYVKNGADFADPGSATGVYTTNTVGNFIQGSTGTLVIGAETLATYSTVVVSGTADVAGVISVNVDSGFTATNGDVLSGVIATTGGATNNVASVVDNSSVYDFVAVLNGNNIDLQILLAIDPNATLLSLASARDAQTRTMAQRFARLFDSQSRDCQTFGDQGLCASLTGEYAQDGHDGQAAGGALTVAYRFGPRMRLGGFVDYTPSLDAPAGVDLGTATNPLFGAFIGYDASGMAGIGLQAKIVGAYQSGDVTITRDASATGVEPGSGQSKISGGGVGAEMAFGMPVAGSTVFSPYTGIAYTTVERAAYVEPATGTVSAPVSYGRYYIGSTTASAGLRLTGMATPRFAYSAGIGVEYDVARDASSFNGTSGIVGLSSFSLANGWNDTLFRLTGSIGFAYSFRENQAIAGSVAYKGDAAFTGAASTLFQLGLRSSF